MNECSPSYADSCVISDDLDNPVASMSKTTNDFASERDETEGIDSISGDSEAHMLAW